MRTVLLLGCLVAVACGGEEDVDASGDTDTAQEGDACAASPDDELPACEDGLACEPAPDGEAQCAAPFEIHGQVRDALSGDPIPGAHVAALDERGIPAGAVAVSDIDGNYVLTVSTARLTDGSVVPTTWTLFCTANDYLPFPAGLRPAIPINSQDAAAPSEDQDEDQDDQDERSGYVLRNASTDVTLLIRTSSDGPERTVSGIVEDGPEQDSGGTLVVAQTGPGSAYAIADAGGHYTLFNVPTGDVTIAGYHGGLHLEPAQVGGDGDVEGVDLLASDTALASVRGSVNIVNAPGGALTSVVLVPVDVYNEGLERGPVPVGLRAPGAPEAPNVSGAFEIAGVPPGRYKTLAAFENDALVRDPDTSIAGTDIVEVVVAGSDIDLDESFKITEALDVFSPGAEAPEVVSGTPTFVFADDSSEDRYDVILLDAFGEVVWEAEIPGVSGGDRVEVPYAGPALDGGAYYQFRATSIRETPNKVTPISRTEDLRGVFVAG